MDSKEFAFWLKGALEIGGKASFTDQRVELITKRASDVQSPDDFVLFVRRLLYWNTAETAFTSLNQAIGKYFKDHLYAHNPTANPYGYNAAHSNPAGIPNGSNRAPLPEMSEATDEPLPAVTH